MSKPSRVIGVGTAVVALGLVGALGVRMSGHAGGEGEGDVPPGCGGPIADGDPAGGADPSQLTAAQSPRNTDVVMASQKPFIATAQREIKPRLEALHLVELNVRPKHIWDEDGKVIVLLQQVWNGLPILGAEARVQLNGDGTPDKTDQRLIDSGTLSPPRLTQEQAIEVATRHADCGTCTNPAACTGCVAKKPEFHKVAFQFLPQRPTALAYRVTVKGFSQDGTPTNAIRFVDTVTGDVESCAQVDACTAFTYDTTTRPALVGAPTGRPDPQMADPQMAEQPDPSLGKRIIEPAPMPEPMPRQ